MALWHRAPRSTVPDNAQSFVCFLACLFCLFADVCTLNRAKDMQLAVRLTAKAAPKATSMHMDN